MMLAEFAGDIVGLNKKANIRYNNPQYNHFIKRLAWLFKASNMGNKTILGPVTVRMQLETNHDIDAVIKQTLDALEMAEIFKNDKQVEYLWVKKLPKTDMDRIGVTICEHEKHKTQ